MASVRRIRHPAEEELELSVDLIWKAPSEKHCGSHPAQFVGFTGSGHLVANLHHGGGSSSYVVIDAERKGEVSRIRRSSGENLWVEEGAFFIQGESVVNYMPGRGESGLFCVEAWSLADKKQIWSHLFNSKYPSALDVAVTPETTYVVSRQEVIAVDAWGNKVVNLNYHDAEHEKNNQAAALNQEKGIAVMVYPDSEGNAVASRVDCRNNSLQPLRLEGLTQFPISLSTSHPSLIASPNYLVALVGWEFLAYKFPELNLVGRSALPDPIHYSAQIHGRALLSESRTSGWVVSDLEKRVRNASPSAWNKLNGKGGPYMISDELALITPDYVDVFPSPENILGGNDITPRRYNNSFGITGFLTDRKGNIYAHSDSAIYRLTGEIPVRVFRENGSVRNFGGDVKVQGQM
ncbi:hypothetical protein HYU14_05875 [Candidatus Woesearchaeota archaeon]|nr:hypothetical protein [Candidatus Woesearchaeota archaeon]